MTLTATFSSNLDWSASLPFELVADADPFILTGPTQYLSTDLRAYQVATDGTGSLFGVGFDPTVPEPTTTFVHSVIEALSGSTAAQALFETSLSTSAEEAAVSTVTTYPTDNGNTGTPVYNFAFARVTLQGLADTAHNVRVFFRMFQALQTGTAFDPATLYRSTPLPGGANPSDSQVDTQTAPNPNAPTSSADPSYPWQTRVPLLGVKGTDIVTIPFFAVPRVGLGNPLWEQPPDWPNTQTISPASGDTGEPVYAFFGCWLDINQCGVAQFPKTVPAIGPDGPFFATDNPLPQSITSLVRSQHQCLVAEVAFDEIPIPSGAVPGESDKLAQRNLTVVGGTN